MIMKYYITLLFMIYWFLWLQACRPKPPEPDPCLGKNPVTADFHIYEGFPGGYPDGWELYDTDTVVTDIITFTALEKAAQYEWHLGTETIRKKTFTRSGFPPNVNIAVSLKVIKTPDKTCFPKDSGIVSKTRVFFAASGIDRKFAVDGKFRGSNIDNPNHSFNIEIDVIYLPPGGDPDPFIGDWTSLLANLVEGCNITGFDTDAPGYKQFHIGFNRAFDCLRPMGIARVHGINNDSITIKYSVQKAPGGKYIDIREDKIFKGIRIN